MNTNIVNELVLAQDKARYDEYGIPVDSKLEGGLKGMRNLSEGIWQRGIQQGIQQEREDMFRLISGMLSAGETAEAVKRMAEDEEFFRAMQKKYLCL